MRLLTVQFQFTVDTEKAIYETSDIELFIPDGIRIAYITGKEGANYHPNYQYLSDKNKIEEKEKNRKSSKGCKVKNIKLINPKTGEKQKFESSITFGIICPNNAEVVYSAKIFFSKSGNISGISELNDDYIKRIIGILFEFFNEKAPERNIKLLNYSTPLMNMNSKIVFPKYKPKKNTDITICFNFHNIVRLMRKYEYDTDEYWGEMVNIDYDRSATNLVIKVFKENMKSCHIKIFPGGSICLNGGKNESVIEKIITTIKEIIHQLMITDLHKVVQFSYPNRMTKDIVKTHVPISAKIKYDSMNRLVYLEYE